MSARRRIYATQDLGVALVIMGSLALRREPFKFSADDSESGPYYNITASEQALEDIVFENKQRIHDAQTARRKTA